VAALQDAPRDTPSNFGLLPAPPGGLDGDTTVVREIASEKNQALFVIAAQNNVIVPAVAVSPDVATDVWLAFDNRQHPAILHGPSHVDSPPMQGARLALLRVRDFGMSADPHVVTSSGRRVGSHVYLDETNG
jgi:hypothetical protein